MVAHLDTHNFGEKTSKGLVFVDFYAQWCGPCKITAPIIDELAQEMPDVSFFKIDVDEQNDIAMRFGIMSIPTFVIFKDGQEVHRFVGARDKSGFQNEINKTK